MTLSDVSGEFGELPRTHGPYENNSIYARSDIFAYDHIVWYNSPNYPNKGIKNTVLLTPLFMEKAGELRELSAQSPKSHCGSWSP